MRRSFLKFSAITLLVVSLLITAHAQKTTGSITGTVADATDALVPEATVKIVEQNTGASRTSATSVHGSFTFPDVPAGIYNVTVTKQGFKVTTQTGLQVHVADTKTMRFKLEVGAGSDMITVESSPVLVETQTGAASNIILGPQVRELPLNGRSFVQLTTLVPGASPAENIEFTNRGLFAGVDISYNGAAVTNNQWLVDGANNNDVGSQRTILIFPSIDAIEEFKILRSSYGPEHGNAAGAQVNVITRGGGNRFHGSGYYFGRNDVLAAKSYFLGRGVSDCGVEDPRCEKGKLRWNGWGYTIGGPIKKDKIFFFWSQEWNREVRGQTRTGMVPTALELAGDFSQTCAVLLNPNFRVPNDPLTGIPFPGNVIPPNRLSPAGQAYLRTLPTANVTADPCANPNWIDSVPIVQNWRQESVRGDVKLTDSTTLMLRWAQDSWVNGQHAAVERGLWGDDKYPAVDDAWNQPGKLAVAKLTTTFGSTAVNDFQFSWTGNRINIQRIGDAALNDAVFAAMPTFYPLSGKLRGDSQPIPICWCGGLSGTIGALGQWDNRQDLFAWRDDFSKVIGNHALKFGVAYDRNAKDEQVGQENGGFWGVAGFQSPWTATSGNQYADFLLRDTVWGWNESDAEFPIQIRWRTLEFYGGDSWRVHPRFTLEYGLRWSFLYRPFTDDNRLAGFSPDAYDPLLAGSPCNGIVMAAGAPNECQALGFAGGTFFENRSLVRNDNNAIAPRLGFAWDVTGKAKFVLRGGVGQFFARDRLTALDVGAVNPPFTIGGGGERILDPDINDLDGDGNTTEFLTFDFGESGSPQRGLDPEARLTNTWQWNLTADTELWKNTRLEVAYVGTRGVHIQTTHNANQVVHSDLDNDGMDDRLQNALGFGTNRPFAAGDSEGRIIIWSNRGDSIYHALQTMFSTKFGRGSIAQVAYTWSRNIGNASLAYVGTDQAIPDYQDPRANRGPVDFDRKHILSANVIYNLPELNDRNSLMRNVFGGWQLGSIISFTTGPALTVIGGVQGSPSPSGTSSGQQFANRPLRVFSEPCRSNSNDPVQWLNPNAFTWNGFDLGTNGNTGPGQCYGPPTRTVDLAFDKNWKLPWFGGDKARLQFRFEIFNAFNTPQFRDLNLDFDVQGSAACGGTAVSPDANNQLQGAFLCNGSFGQARNVGRLNREMQYGLKLIF